MSTYSTIALAVPTEFVDLVDSAARAENLTRSGWCRTVIFERLQALYPTKIKGLKIKQIVRPGVGSPSIGSVSPKTTSQKEPVDETALDRIVSSVVGDGRIPKHVATTCSECDGLIPKGALLCPHCLSEAL